MFEPIYGDRMAAPRSWDSPGQHCFYKYVGRYAAGSGDLVGVFRSKQRSANPFGELSPA